MVSLALASSIRLVLVSLVDLLVLVSSIQLALVFLETWLVEAF